MIVTFSPVAVVSVKLEEDTLLTAPDDPPAAGPDRALDPWAPDPEPPVGLGAGAAVVEALLEVAATIP